MLPFDLVVEAWRPRDHDCAIDLRAEAWSLALDQRAFGPRRLVVAFCDGGGAMTLLAHTDRTDPPHLALAACCEYAVDVGVGLAAAVAFCDEPLHWEPPPDDLGELFATLRDTCYHHGIHLVDWFSCDDDLFRSTRIAVEPESGWWDLG